MSPLDISGASNYAARAGGGTATTQNNAQANAARSQPAQATAPAAPAYSAQAIVQSRESEKSQVRVATEAGNSLMLQSQSLAVARQEEVRLQQKLADLRESIEASETQLRTMQSQHLSLETH